MFVFLQERIIIRDEWQREIDDPCVRIERAWTQLMQNGVKEGAFRKGLNLTITTKGILGICNWMNRWYVKGDRLNASQIAEVFASLLLDGLTKRDEKSQDER